MSKPAPLQILQAAVAHHQAGKLTEAEQLYRQVLEQDPNQPDALNLLGVIAQQTGNLKEALGLFDRALSAAPELAAAHYNRANTLRDAGRIGDAQAAYEAALTCDPGFQDALLNLGVLLYENGQTDDALEHFTTLARLAPGNSNAHYNIGRCHHARNRLNEACSALSQSLALNPQNPDAQFALANVYADMIQYDDAITHIKAALSLKPEWSQAHSVMGITLARAGQFENAITACKKALALEPTKSAFQISLGFVYQLAGHEEDAVEVFSLAAKNKDITADAFTAVAKLAGESLGPWQALNHLESSLQIGETPAALNNIGVILQDMDLHALAAPYYEAALHINPQYSKAANATGYLNLLQGRLNEGWPALDAQLSDEKFFLTRGGKTDFWRGQDLSSKTLLVFFTDGIGEHIIQSSFINDIVGMAHSIIIECVERFVPILKKSFPNVEIISAQNRTSVRQALNRADYQIPALNLGRILRNNFDQFPKHQNGFLNASPDLIKHYRDKYLKRANGKRVVGLSWLSGNARLGQYKSLSLDALRPVLDTETMSFVSLQYGPMSNTLAEFSEETGIEIYADPSVDQLRDLDPFFAQVAAMDLVITISNTTAHIAGALGVPAWVMLPRQGLGPLWFWFIDREDSPWYPSVRLFRQKSMPTEDSPWWPEVIDEVATALPAWLAKPLTPRAIS
jgi:tetratricopeptide (TPR) repeat protein